MANDGHTECEDVWATGGGGTLTLERPNGEPPIVLRVLNWRIHKCVAGCKDHALVQAQCLLDDMFHDQQEWRMQNDQGSRPL